MTYWRRATVWNNQKAAPRKSTSSWEPVSALQNIFMPELLCASIECIWCDPEMHITAFLTSSNAVCLRCPFKFNEVLSCFILICWHVLSCIPRLAVELFGQAFVCRNPSSIWDHVPWLQHIRRYYCTLHISFFFTHSNVKPQTPALNRPSFAQLDVFCVLTHLNYTHINYLMGSVSIMAVIFGYVSSHRSSLIPDFSYIWTLVLSLLFQ